MDAALVLFEELDWRMLHYVLLGLQHSIKMDWKMMELCKSVERKREVGN